MLTPPKPQGSQILDHHGTDIREQDW